MASESSSTYRQPVYTRDRFVIQDYGRFLNSATASVVLPTQEKKETKSDRLQATNDLFEAVTWAKFSGSLLFNAHCVDFSALGGSFLARGGFFQTRHFPGQRVAKYPLIPDDTGILPKSTYESLLKELRILCHPPLREHENIVRLTSIQWTRIDPVAHSCIPVFLLEEAQHGSLEQYAASEKPGIETCLRLSQEIGSGLQALHASGIVHGDLKFGNVLVFDLGNGRVKAKLTDFGGSVIKDKNHPTVTLTMGTPPWTSPEHDEPVQTSLLCGTDTYSYGLLVWRLFLQGQSPFDGQDNRDIWRRKKDDLILGEAASSLEERYSRVMLAGHASSGTRFQSYKLAVSIPRRCLQHCLSSSIEKRDLDEAVTSLYYASYTFPENIPTPKSGASKDKELFAHSRLLVNHLRLFDVPCSVKAMVHQCMIDITENPQAVDRITRIDSLFQLSLQTFDGFGSTDDSMASAASSMRKAALAGQPTARVMLGQFYEASGVEVDAAMRSECETLLVEAVERGSLLARIWLRRSNPEALKEAERKQAQKVAGVSLGQEKDSQFHPKDMVDGLFGETAFASLAPRLSAFLEIQTHWLSERRNSLLHTGAAFGVNPDRFRLFLGVLRGTINARDSAGNTALLIAIRFNNVDIAKILLEGGADASLANKRGETPFHWLVAIEKLECTVDLVELLKRNGKNAFNATAEPPCTEDIFGINHGGTALHWAVELGMTDLARTLVSCGADIQNTFKGVRPVDIAVRRNKPEILRMFLDELRQRSETLAQPVLSFTLGLNEKKASVGAMFDNYAFQAIASYPFHERLAYGGKGWVNALRDTLMVLREFGLAPKLPIWALSQLLSSTGNSTTILEILSEEDVLEGGSDQEKFWADITEKIILSSDTTNVLYAMKRAKASSADGRIPNAEKILDICTESFGCDGAVVDAIANDGVKMDFPTKQFRTPLMGAILHRNFEIASALIRNGADVNAMWKPIYPNSPDEVHPDVNILFEHVTVNQDTALAPLRYLLEPLHSRKDAVPSFVVVPSKKKTALHLACRYGNPLIMDYLLKKFDTPYHLDFIDEGGFTALHFAVFDGHAEVARKLCAKGARADILAGSEDLDPEHRRNALDYCHRLFAPDIDSLKNSHGVGRDLQDVYLGRLEIAKMLVRECQAVRTSGSKDDDDMVWSVKLCRYAVQNDMSRLLRGALENLRNDPASETPWQDAINLLLIEAALRGHTGSTKILIDYGADVNQVLRGDEQMTLLHQVVANRDDKMVYQLLRAGAKVNAYDKAGQTPLTYGCQCQDLRTCRVLKHFGGALTLDRESMARILAKSVSGDIEGSMAFLRDQNLHLNAKLAGEPSDDDTAGESEANEEDGEEEASDDDAAEEGAAAKK